MSLRLVVMALAIGAALGSVGGYWLRGTDAPVREDVSYKPAVRQPDASVIAARVPDAAPVKPPHTLPKGSKEVRRIKVAVQPTQPDCEPVAVNLSLVEQDGGQRVIASAENGLILSAIDTPIVPALMAAPRRPWAAGASYNPITRKSGVWVERDIARLRVGADVMQGETGDLTAMVRVGWRW